MLHATSFAGITVRAVIVCWFVFAAVFLFRKRPPKVAEAKREPAAGVGIALQMVAYFLVWFHPPHYPFLPSRSALVGGLGLLFFVFTTALALGSAWLIAAAVRTLGKQWAVSARLVEDHKLVTAGPYRFVRNPIYTGMLGMLIATGLAMEHWLATIPAIIFFVVGMVLRVRSEEKLLREAFGTEFDAYAQRVPAALPGIF